MNPKILVGCPTYDGKAYCLKEYAEAVKNLDYDNYKVILVDNSEDEDYYGKIKQLGIEAWHFNEKGFSAREKIAACRNLLRKIAVGDYDYFLSLEQDVMPPKNIIKKLLSHKKRIISAVYNMKMDNGKEMPLLWRFLDEKELNDFIIKNPNLKEEVERVNKNKKFSKRYEPEELPKNQLVKVAACGLGAVLIHKDVLQKIAFRSKGEAYDDMFFCQDALANNFEIFADTSVACRHLQDERFVK